jgi:hypothetical protein
VSAPSLKASAFLSEIQAIRSLCTPERFTEVVRALPADTAALVERPPLPVEWMEARHARELIRAAYRVAFDSDDSFVLEVARRATRADMATLYRGFVLTPTADHLIERASTLYSTYIKGGTVSVKRVDEHVLEVTQEGVPAADPVMWMYRRGVIWAMLEAVQLKIVRLEPVRGGGKESYCVFRVEWAD